MRFKIEKKHKFKIEKKHEIQNREKTWDSKASKTVFATLGAKRFQNLPSSLLLSLSSRCLQVLYIEFILREQAIRWILSNNPAKSTLMITIGLRREWSTERILSVQSVCRCVPFANRYRWPVRLDTTQSHQSQCAHIIQGLVTSHKGGQCNITSLDRLIDRHFTLVITKLLVATHSLGVMT